MTEHTILSNFTLIYAVLRKIPEGFGFGFV